MNARAVWLLVAMGTLCASCGDNDENVNPDAGADATPPTPDGSPDAANPFVPPTPALVPLAAAGTDQLLGAAAGPGGTLYAVGFRAPGVMTTDDREMVLVRLTAAGALDTTFSGDGITTINVTVGGRNGELARGIAVQSTGKVVIAGAIEHDIAATGPAASDRDVAVVRFNTDGTVDDTFGDPADDGIQILDLNTGYDNAGTWAGADAPWGLTVDSMDRVVVHAAQLGEGLDMMGDPRTDTDFAVLRLTADGVLDDTFGGGDGKFLLDIQESDASVRAVIALPDDTLLAGGYSDTPGLGSTQPVVFKLTTAGVLDTNFATGGVFHEIVLATITEVYALGLQGTSIVTAGYGRATGDTNDWVSLRFTAGGVLDTTWGDQGAVVIDPSGTMVGDNCRNVVSLPGNRTLLIGSVGPGNVPEQNATFAVLDGNGALDPAFGTGLHMYDIGGNDAFWGGAVSGDNVIIVGFKGGGTAPTPTMNDDAYAVVLPLP
jgi:uncharacterized delta-60 repeat protein